MRTYYIYTITNPLDNKIIYVGQTTDFKRRKGNYYSYMLSHNRFLKAMLYDITLQEAEPVFAIVQEVQADKAPYDIEKEWIIKLLDEGQPLCNKEHQWHVGKVNRPTINNHIVTFDDVIFKALQKLSGSYNVKVYMEEVLKQHALTAALKDLQQPKPRPLCRDEVEYNPNS